MQFRPNSKMSSSHHAPAKSDSKSKKEAPKSSPHTSGSGAHHHSHQPMASSGITSATSEQSTAMVDQVGGALDSAMDEGVSVPQSNRGVIFGIMFLLCLGSLVYISLENYKKRQSRVEQEDLPRLAHAVQEVQGWRGANVIALLVMLATGMAIILALSTYRKARVERARKHESTFWFLCGTALLCGVTYLLHRYKERRRGALRREFRRVARSPNLVRRYAIGATIIVMLAALIWYRRNAHKIHLARKKRKQQMGRMMGGGGNRNNDRASVM